MSTAVTSQKADIPAISTADVQRSTYLEGTFWDQFEQGITADFVSAVGFVPFVWSAVFAHWSIVVTPASQFEFPIDSQAQNAVQPAAWHGTLKEIGGQDEQQSSFVIRLGA